MKPLPKKDDAFSQTIERASRQMKKSRREGSGFLYYASLIGMGGWLLTLPIVAGAYLGNYLDKKTDMGVSWSITFILLGIAVGVFNTWHFLYRE